MKCYACNTKLSILFEEIELNGCQQCDLLWFTQGQLERIDLHSEILASFAEKTSEKEIADAIDCPTCQIPLHFHKFPTAPQVSYPECYKCGGCYLNSNQLKEIRENSMNEAQLETYRNQLAHSIEGFTQAEDIRVSRQGKNRFARAWQQFRFWSKENDKE